MNASAYREAVRDKTPRRARPATLPGQIVLVLQGGGALGAYQVGVYQALHEAGIEPEWVIGTSIGAIDGEPYWDGGIYSNTPIEAVLDDKPRRDSVIFSVNVWQPDGQEPASIWQVMGRQKDIQFASRADSHIARQKQIHHLRHVIRELARHLPPKERESAAMKELASWGCGTTMHVVRLLAPGLADEDHTKDIDFSPSGVRARWRAGASDPN